jgi:3-hydroxyisobutyrate dehydrogenase-like beta-hydroxyacid dehydrogenase
VSASGGRYVEAAIMSPIAPKRIASPILLGGPHAATFEEIAKHIGFVGVEVFSPKLGRASAAKMCRSVMVKGLEALLAESLVSARHYGVEETVLASLHDLFPTPSWPALARYMISRSLVHGKRRAEEMREVAKTVREAGMTPWMSEGCVERQSWASRHCDAASSEDLSQLLDRLLIGTSSEQRPC